MSEPDRAQPFLRRDGTLVRAARYDGRVSGASTLQAAFPGRVLPHPYRDDALLVVTRSGRKSRIEAGDWVIALPDGSLETDPDDQFHIRHHQSEAIAA